MKRRRNIIRTALVAGLMAMPGVAYGQTTTSTIATTTTTTVQPSTTTTVSVTTSTSLPHPCAGQPCTTEPPSAVLSTSSTQIVADRGGYCWRDPIGPLTGCVALARPPNYTPPTLVVTQGESVTVQFTASVPMTPSEVVLLRDGDRVALPASNPTLFRVDLAPGIYEQVGLSTRWVQGEVPYGFRLDVRRPDAPATPTTGGKVTLTG
jgi:hypothetical protein